MAQRRNRVRCLKCLDEPESKHRHDMVFCKCGHVAVDGGHDYMRRVWNGKEEFEELSEGLPDSQMPFRGRLP